MRSLIPKSKAKTAMGLLSEIRRLILAEPKRYNQGTTLSVDQAGPHAPVCGTIGCVAGWVVVLRTNHRRWDGVLERAAEVLGLDRDQAEMLFDGDAAGQMMPGTMRHAKRGAAHIARFQKKYAAQLKAKRV